MAQPVAGFRFERDRARVRQCMIRFSEKKFAGQVCSAVIERHSDLVRDQVDIRGHRKSVVFDRGDICDVE
jgi:hypothetical protein